MTFTVRSRSRMNRTHLCPAFPRHMCTTSRTTNCASAHMLHRPTANCFQGRTGSWYCFTVQPSSKGQMTWDDTCSSNNYAHYDLTVTPFAFSGTTFHISCTRSILEKGTWRFMVIPSYLILMTISTRLWSHGSRIYVMRTPGLAPRTTSSLQHSVYPLSGIRMAWRFRGMAPEFSLWHGSRSGHTCYSIETDFWL